jgi:hypothetical protein
MYQGQITSNNNGSPGQHFTGVSKSALTCASKTSESQGFCAVKVVSSEVANPVGIALAHLKKFPSRRDVNAVSPPYSKILLHANQHKPQNKSRNLYPSIPKVYSASQL